MAGAVTAHSWLEITNTPVRPVMGRAGNGNLTVLFGLQCVVLPRESGQRVYSCCLCCLLRPGMASRENLPPTAFMWRAVPSHHPGHVHGVTAVRSEACSVASFHPPPYCSGGVGTGMD